jgi:hypothetical protein
MKWFAVSVMALALFAAGCGSNHSASNINGNWNAMLVDSGGTSVFTFGTNLTLQGNGTLAITNFSFNTNSPCFVSGETESGTFALTGNFNGNVNGKLGMTVQSGTPAGNTLTLAGTANGNTITGNWTLTGAAGCTGNGTFTMTRM